MQERLKCVRCSKDAIGIQSFGCRSACVCEDHAYHILRALRPGEHYSSGDSSFVRFGKADTVPEDGGTRPQDCG